MSYATLVSTVAGVTIAGIARQYAYEPISVMTADLPASYVRLPNGTRDNQYPICGSDLDTTRSIELVVVLEPAGQEMVSADFAATVAMMDTVEAAIDTADIAPMTEYTINGQAVQTLDGVTYWGIVASITVRG